MYISLVQVSEFKCLLIFTMANRHVFVDTETPTPKRIDTGGINWEYCILCHENGTGLQCPYAVKNSNLITGGGYTSLAEQLASFNELGKMLINVNIKQLDDGDSIEAILTGITLAGISPVV